MRITRRQLRHIVREALSRDAMALEPRILDVWDRVRADTLQALGGRATWDEIADEIMASAYDTDPGLVEELNLLPFDDVDALFKKIFGAGSRY